ncbi:hypothetical protein MGAST_09995 [Mycobacterium gastri 'Wayne']|uniref:Uncharacterized protein n=1 Tax=Mycobacterium gastri TaxID=1777 RepID=A0A1X1V023_MYCGS|nr:hypothetical protein MGAST_09995 [Mycobacterium gastri 'Wayne']ORV62387.1 hypothetical protein AWC07_16870 [Mycobacterium gastri]
MRYHAWPRGSLVTELINATALAGGKSVDGKPPQIMLTVSSGSRTFATKPVHPAALTLQLP